VFSTIPKRDALLRDLERAGIERADDRGRTIDRHSLRTTFCTWLEQVGVGEVRRKLLARHALEGQTQRHYTKLELSDLWGEIEKLPPSTAQSPSSRLRSLPAPTALFHSKFH